MCIEQPGQHDKITRVDLAPSFRTIAMLPDAGDTAADNVDGGGPDTVRQDDTPAPNCQHVKIPDP
jgi:hypothetical protein